MKLRKKMFAYSKERVRQREEYNKEIKKYRGGREREEESGCVCVCL